MVSSRKGKVIKLSFFLRKRGKRSPTFLLWKVDLVFIDCRRESIFLKGGRTPLSSLARRKKMFASVVFSMKHATSND